MKIGFIGSGNMAQAIIGGLLKNKMVSKEDITASDVSKEAAERVKEKFGINTCTDNKEAAKADIVFLAIKPIFAHDAIESIKNEINEKTIIISIVAGKSLSWLENEFGKGKKIVRTMPNTPALVGEGITAACPNELINEDEKKTVLDLLSCFGQAEIVPERIMDAVVAVSGSSPAYVFLFIEAMADAAVAEGMPRNQAYKFAAQSVLGSAKMVLETGKHPGELKDMVCSPAGTTIEAVKVLEEKGFRGAVMDAMLACADKNRNI